MNQHLIENRQIRIFISSTFQDMKAERDYLMNKTFPLLRKKASERDVTLIELDLRWGITEAEAQNGKVVEVCLNEIENSHPFFIGLLGERYGWCPSVKELMKNENLRDRYGWLEKDLKEGLSVTEIEMQYGVLRSKEPIHAYFYIKRGMSSNVSISSAAEPPLEKIFSTPETGQQMDSYKLERLKKAIRDDKRYPVADYNDAEDLGNQVEAAFMKLLDELFPQKEITFLEKERIAQKAFLNSRCSVYIPDENNFLALDQFLEEKEQQCYVVTGVGGMGKSALIANWLRRRENDSKRNVIYHFIGNSSSENDYHRILKRLIDEIRDIYQLPKKEDDEQLGQKKDPKDELQELFVEISVKKPLLIVLDGVNQLEEKGNIKRLSWLPASPKNVKMLFSTLEGDRTMNTFRELHYPLLVLQPLDVIKRRTLIVDYLHKYGKKLSEVQITRMIANELNKNTLVLRTLIDELIRFGVYEKLDERIDYYLEAKDISDFFQRVLFRCEQDYGKELVCRTLSLIAVSRNGLREDELLALTGLSPLYWSQFYCALNAHFTVKGGLITFSHQYMCEAVEKVYLMEERTVNNLREALVRYFEQGYGYRAYDELPYQYAMLGDDDSLYHFLLDFKVFGYLHDKDTYELGSYWHKLLESEKRAYSLEEYFNLPTEGLERGEIGHFYNNIGFFVRVVMADNSLSLKFHQESLNIYLEVFGKSHFATANIYNNIGVVYYCQGDYSTALIYYDKSLSIRLEVFGEFHPYTALSYNNIGGVYDNLSDYSTALVYYERSLDIYLEAFGESHFSTAAVYNNIGGVYDGQGDYSTALAYYEKSLNIYFEVFGESHPYTALIYNNIGMIFSRQGDYSTALDYYERTLNVYLEVFGESHFSMANIYNNIGTVYRNLGDYSVALNYYKKALSIYIKVLGEFHSKTADSCNNIGGLYCSQSDYSTALVYYDKSLNIRLEVLGVSHPDTALSYNNIGGVYDNLGDYSTALVYYEKSLGIYIEVFGESHFSTATVYNNIGGVYDSQGDYSTALAYYDKSLNIRLGVLGRSHHATAESYNNIGFLYRNLGDYSTALVYYKKSLNINLEIFGESHPTTINSVCNIADAYFNLQQYQAALPYFLKEMEYNIEIKGEFDESIYPSYSRIGVCYWYISEYLKAVCYLVEACNYEQKEAMDIYFLADGLYQLGRYSYALPLLESIADQFSGEMESLVNLLCASSIFAMRNYSIALSRHLAVLNARKELYEPDSDEVAVSCSWVGRCYVMLGDVGKGIPYLQEDIRIIGEDPWASISWRYLGIAYQKLQDFGKASECFRKAFALLENCSGNLYLQKTELSNSYAAFLLVLKDFVNATCQIQEALKFAHLYLEYLKCDEHPVLGHIWMLQSDIMEAEQGANEQVGQLRTQANEIFKEYLGVDCPFIRNPLQT